MSIVLKVHRYRFLKMRVGKYFITRGQKVGRAGLPLDSKPGDKLDLVEMDWKDVTLFDGVTKKQEYLPTGRTAFVEVIDIDWDAPGMANGWAIVAIDILLIKLLEGEN